MTSRDDTSDKCATYIRGGGGVANARRATSVVVGFCILVLVALVGVLVLGAVQENSRLVRLRRNGVPVSATVTGCLALASGTGITASGFRCNGMFTLNGRRYNDVIGGDADFHPVGEMVQAVTDPRDPGVLFAAPAVVTPQPSWMAFVAPAIPLALMLSLVAVVVWWSRHRTLPHDVTRPGANSPPSFGASARNLHRVR